MKIYFPTIILVAVACESDKGVTVFNPNPEAEISSHADGADVTEGYLVTFVGNVDDPNHSAEELTTVWRSNTRILCDEATPENNGTTSCQATLGTDDTSITLEVKDTENAPGSHTISINVIPSQAPSCEITAPEANGIYYSDQLITFSGVLSDAEDASSLLSAYWFSNQDGILADVNTTPNTDGSIQGYTNLSQGQHAIEMHGEDTTGKLCLDSVIIAVGPPNSAPSCEITEPATESAGPEGELIVFSANAADVDIPANMLSASWSSDKDGDLGTSAVNSDGTISFPFSDLSTDTHVITLTVSDELDATCTASIIYTIGSPPSISIDAPLDGEVYDAGDSISFRGTVSDNEDQPHEITLDWQLNGSSFSTQGATSTGSVEFSDSSLPYDTYHLVVTATDSDGLTNADSLYFTVNAQPSQPVVAIGPSPAYTADDLVMLIDTPSIDPEGSNVSYIYEWLKNGVLQSAYTSVSLPASATSSGDVWTVRVTPSDGLAVGTPGEASVTVQNTSPTIDSIVITPSNPIYNDSTLTCTATVTDPDEPLTPTYEWTIGSIVFGNGSTLDLSTTPTMPGDVIACVASVSDSGGETDSDSTAVSVDNRLPNVDSISISPSTAYTNDSIIASATFSDSDGQTVSGTYSWHVIDAATNTDNEVQSGSSTALSGVDYFDRDDEVYVIVTPNDGTDDGATLTSSSMVIANSPPSSPTLSLSPSPASVTSDDLTCSIDLESTDDDGDAILYTYRWTDPNGSVQQTTTEVPDTSDVFLAAGTTEGTWTCEVTPHDGIDDGASSTANVLVGSTCSSLYFDQASNLEVMDSSGLALNEVSISLWIQPYDTDYGSWVSKKGRGYGGHHAYHILQDNGAFRVRFQIANCYPCDDAIHLIDIRGGSITPYRWHHVAATYDASTGLGSLYVDGVLVANEVKGSGLAYYTTTEPLNIGSEHYTNVYEGYTFGLANNVQIFDAPLSSTDIAALAQNNSIQSSASLVYTTTNTSTDIIDQSGNGFDGWVSGVTDTETCPEEDLDGDGTSAWEDCDDNNPAVTTGPSGGGAYCPGIDCEQILDDGYSNGDGTYWIDPLGSGAFEVHCDMTTDGGGWTRVVHDDYAIDNCPNGWTRSSGLTTVCTRETSSSNDLIRSTAIDVFGITYDEVRGYLEGYQFGSNDGFGDNPPNDINDTYGDVVSFTNSPTGNREHLFSYVVGFGKTNNDDSNCPGVNGGANPPSFVGSDYYCETANLSASGPSSQWYTNPLYQGYWFQVASTPTDVDIEARIMGTHVSSNEDIGVGKMELYIR